MRDTVPTTAHEIMNRINEISFNSSLMREMRAIAFVSKLIDDRAVAGDRLHRMLIHAVDAEDFMRELSVTSKLNADWEFLCHLRDVGRTAAERWLAASFDALGTRSTIDIRDKYL
jgi:NTE family protein